MTPDTPDASVRTRVGWPRRNLPSAAELAALGTVLCVYARRYGGELGGWSRATGAELRCGIDSDGWHECLHFRDREGDCCWRLYLLPDSDFLAWERLQARLPVVEAKPATGDAISGRLWRRLSARVGVAPWQSSVIRLHALGRRRTLLAASPAPISPLGADMLQRLARIEGLEAAARPVDGSVARM
ncbi:MAG: Hemin transport protein [Pseudomonadota bacterium]